MSIRQVFSMAGIDNCQKKPMLMATCPAGPLTLKRYSKLLLMLVQDSQFEILHVKDDRFHTICVV